jgi:exopolysaccharide biosynthesis polyprenyl glycosylphosphotransferase
MIHEPLSAPAGPGESHVDVASEPRPGTTRPEPAVETSTAPEPEPTETGWPSLRHPDAPTSAPNFLRNRLIRIDATVVAISWTLALVLGPDIDTSFVGAVPVIAFLVASTIVALAALQLYRGRISAVRRVARRRLALAAIVAPGLLVHTRTVSLTTDGGASWLVGATLVAVGGLIVGREVFEQWLRSARARGHHVRPILLDGSADEVVHLVRLLDAHPEIGCRAVGWVGPAPIRPLSPDLALVPWLGESDRIADAAVLVGTGGVLIAPSIAGDPSFGELVRTLQARRLHVQVATGLWGIDPARLRTAPLAHEPCFYLEPLRQGSGPRRIKRAGDIFIATTVLVLTAPILAVAALAVKIHDGGPVIFRQVRIGLGGEPFELHKFRTMSIDAEARLAALTRRNERTGPLFKMDHDPRVTPVGRVLRATSIDELPQLVDVLAGRLSLVGPRPALPDEVAAFDAPLLERHRVLPGVTGLWQVEARHNPSFDAYRHLDLFYVENWTLGLDVAILAATVKTVFTDAAGALATRHHGDDR